MRTPANDLARQVRERVSARAAAERYGFEPNRAGYICCPFHTERTASLKLYEDGGWHCFGCGAGGSSIDFVMGLFGLDFKQAVVRLDLDFSLRLTGDRAAPPPRPGALEARRREGQRRDELRSEIKNLTNLHRRLHEEIQLFTPSAPDIEALPAPFVQALKQLPEVDWRLEELENELGRMEHGKNRDPGVPTGGLSGNDCAV